MLDRSGRVGLAGLTGGGQIRGDQVGGSRIGRRGGGRVGRRVGLAVLAGGAAGLVYARLEAEWFALRLVTVPVLPAGQASWSILHLSDLHMSGGSGWLTRRRVAWIRRLAALEPDLVITTGDNLARPSGLATLVDALEPLLERPGAFVFGSNDYYAASFKSPTRYLQRRDQTLVVDRRPDLPVKALRRALIEAGWVDLNNARARLKLPGGADLSLVGLADPHAGWDVMPDVMAGGLLGDPPAADAVRIGVVHAPYARALAALVDDGVDLILAGHTHGGQVGLPGFGALVSNSDLDPGQAKGLSRWPDPSPGRVNTAPRGPDLWSQKTISQDSTWLHVSAGLGTSPYTPFRFATRPEATLLTLVPTI